MLVSACGTGYRILCFDANCPINVAKNCREGSATIVTINDSMIRNGSFDCGDTNIGGQIDRPGVVEDTHDVEIGPKNGSGDRPRPPEAFLRGVAAKGQSQV